jgi:hypothetical protein
MRRAGAVTRRRAAWGSRRDRAAGDAVVTPGDRDAGEAASRRRCHAPAIGSGRGGDKPLALHPAAGGELELAATDRDISLRSALPESVGSEGAVVVPGELLADPALLPAGEVSPPRATAASRSQATPTRRVWTRCR